MKNLVSQVNDDRTNASGMFINAGSDLQISGSGSNMFPVSQTCTPIVVHATDCGRIESHLAKSGTSVPCNHGCTSEHKNVGPQLENIIKLRDGSSLTENGNNKEKGNKSSLDCQSVELSALKPMEAESACGTALPASAERALQSVGHFMSDEGCAAHEGISRF